MSRRLLLGLTGLTAATALADVTIVRDGHSDHVIVCPADAPDSVAAAAQDLQSYLERATGARLPMVTAPRSPMIALGAAAGLELDGVPLEGYRIVARGQDVRIAGPDLARTPQGGSSNGTRNGVSTFLERFVGVRWLMPGEYGDDVPRQATLSVPETDVVEGPFFLNRRVPYIQERRPDTQQWWARQKLGWSLSLYHSHNWTAIPTSAFDEHPDWFAMRGGVRVPPTGRYKLCITNPGLIRAFADAAMAYFDARPEATCFSLSPADSAGWCECPECTALYETDPNGELSITPAVLRFYNAVARLVAEKYPDRLLAGYIYAAYVFPPQQPIRLEPNVFLVWAPSFDYGYTLFRPQLREQWEQLAAQWTSVTDQIAYYDLPACVSTEAGGLNPPGLKILAFLYPRLQRFGMKGVYVYGVEAWGRGGPLNYLLAKLAWDPSADVEALFAEYCDRCYGPGAAEMAQLWRLLDDEFERYYLEVPSASYTLTSDMMQQIYVRRWPEIERLYRAAEAKITDPAQAARLAAVGRNLTVLCWNLRQFRLLPNADASSFHLSDADFFAFLAKHRGDLALHPTREPGAPGAVREKLVVAAATGLPVAEPVRPFLLRGDQHLVLLPTAARATVRFDSVTARGKLLTWSLYGADGAEIAGGLVSVEVPIALDAAGAGLYHLVIRGGSASYRLQVDGAAWACDGRVGEQGLHFLSRATPLYVEVPAGLASFRLALAADPPGETAIATLVAPDGTVAARFDCSAVSVDRQVIAPATAGWWKLVIEPAAVGVLDDVYVSAGPELAGFFSLAPEAALSVRKVE